MTWILIYKHNMNTTTLFLSQGVWCSLYAHNRNDRISGPAIAAVYLVFVSQPCADVWHEASGDDRVKGMLGGVRARELADDGDDRQRGAVT